MISLCKCSTLEFYNEDTQLPIYTSGERKEYTVEELVELLLDPVNEKICTAQPTAIYHNYSFVISLNCVGGVSDLRADDCRVWIHKGVRKTYVVVDDTKGVVFSKREQPPDDDDIHPNHLYLLTRVYHVLQVSPDFRRMIATLTSQLITDRTECWAIVKVAMKYHGV